MSAVVEDEIIINLMRTSEINKRLFIANKLQNAQHKTLQLKKRPLTAKCAIVHDISYEYFLWVRNFNTHEDWTRLAEILWCQPWALCDECDTCGNVDVTPGTNEYGLQFASQDCVGPYSHEHLDSMDRYCLQHGAVFEIETTVMHTLPRGRVRGSRFRDELSATKLLFTYQQMLKV